MYGMRGAAAYGRVSVESNVLSADPHKLIQLLFEGVQTAIRSAELHIENGQTAEKGKAISKALDIVNSGLLAALDKEQGGEIAEQLEAIYLYVSELLVKANLHNDTSALTEASELLEQIGSAWREIGPAAQAKQAVGS